MQRKARAHPSKISNASMPSDHMSTGKAAVMAIFLFPAAAIACTHGCTAHHHGQSFNCNSAAPGIA